MELFSACSTTRSLSSTAFNGENDGIPEHVAELLQVGVVSVLDQAGQVSCSIIVIYSTAQFSFRAIVTTSTTGVQSKAANRN
jgi:hypothetical protein